MTASGSSSGWPRSRTAISTTCEQAQRYRERRLNYTKTRPTAVSIGQRRKPDPRGDLGLLDVQLVEQLGDGAVEELASVMGVKTFDAEGDRVKLSFRLRLPKILSKPLKEQPMQSRTAVYCPTFEKLVNGYSAINGYRSFPFA